MIDAHRVNAVREAMKSLEECEVEDSEKHHYSMVKGKCVLVLFTIVLYKTGCLINPDGR
jgi:hypothetical protein